MSRIDDLLNGDYGSGNDGIVNGDTANIKSVAIFGHIRPDGDCAGSTLALWNYIHDNYPQIKADIFLEPCSGTYSILRGFDQVKNMYNVNGCENYGVEGGDNSGKSSANNHSDKCDNNEAYDLAFLLDTPSFERVGANGAKCIQKAHITCNIDHHISNPLNLCDTNIVDANASSASEVLYFQLDPAKIHKETASCLYLGIVHDTGAFKYSCTSKRTMQVVGDLIEKGVDFAKIVNETYYTRTYKQTLVTGFVLQNCKLGLEGKVVYSYITQADMDQFGVTPIELSNVIDTLREVGGTEVTFFLYPVNGKYKISLRSNYVVDVNAIAKEFGGGGHIRAAGGDTDKAPEVVIQEILKLIAKQL